MLVAFTLTIVIECIQLLQIVMKFDMAYRINSVEIGASDDIAMHGRRNARAYVYTPTNVGLVGVHNLPLNEFLRAFPYSLAPVPRIRHPPSHVESLFPCPSSRPCPCYPKTRCFPLGSDHFS